MEPMIGSRHRLPPSDREPVRVGAVSPLTISEWPGRVCAIIFCQGCAWRCRYCDKPELVSVREPARLGWQRTLAMLEARRRVANNVVLGGGEPLVQRNLFSAVMQLRERDFQVGLHTAGIFPERLEKVLPWLQWVALDIKALEEDYLATTRVSGSGRKAMASLERMLASAVPSECRTTVHWQLMDEDRLIRLADRLAAMGVRDYAIQLARTRGNLDPGLENRPAPVNTEALWKEIGARFRRFTVRETTRPASREVNQGFAVP